VFRYLQRVCLGVSALICACTSAHMVVDGSVPESGVLGADANFDSSLADAHRPTCTSPDDCEAVMVATGIYNSCALMRSGRVACWGYNAHGELGSLAIESSSIAVTVQDLPPAQRLMNGGFHTCAFSRDHDLWCWGLEITESTPPSRTWIPEGSNAVDLEIGNVRCYLAADGQVYCWGTGRASGLNGTGTMEPLIEPRIPVVGITDAVGLVVGGPYACARTSGGEVWCWGEMLDPTTGTGITALSPIRVLTGVQQVSAGNGVTCGLRMDTDLECWGGNANGRVGVGSELDWVPVPTQLEFPSGTEITQVSVGGSHACAVEREGHVLCWGSNSDGQLGVTSGMGESNVPVQVQDISDATFVSAGSSHTCAVTRSGDVWCWGANNGGALGDGTTETRDYPVQVRGLR